MNRRIILVRMTRGQMIDKNANFVAMPEQKDEKLLVSHRGCVQRGAEHLVLLFNLCDERKIMYQFFHGRGIGITHGASHFEPLFVFGTV